MTENNKEEDCQSELSNADSLEDSEVLDGASSVVSASSEDSLAKYGNNPNVSNGNARAASVTAVNGGKKLVKQKSLIPQPFKRAHTVDDLSKSGNNACVNNSKGKAAVNDTKPSSKENVACSWKHDGVIKQRPCSVDIETTNANNDEQRKVGQSVNSTTTATNKLLHSEVVPIKENISSLKRKEIAHKVHHQPSTDNDEYLTPFQRKDKLIHELKAELKMAQNTIKERDEELEFLKNEQDALVQEVVEQKNNCIGELTKQLAEIHCTHDDLTLSHEESLQTVAELRERIKKLEEEMEARDRKHQEMYLRMYEKGQETALRERQEELERIAKENPDSVSTAELLEKLKTTENKLERWQSIKRKESYDEGDKPETEADATLRFLQDSMFHYLTKEKDASQTHMRAMIGIMGFTEPQKKKIRQAIQEKKKKNPEIVHVLNAI